MAAAADAGGIDVEQRMPETEQMDKVGELEWNKDGIVGWTVASWAFLSL